VTREGSVWILNPGSPTGAAEGAEPLDAAAGDQGGKIRPELLEVA
jgi:hypothetical protein